MAKEILGKEIENGDPVDAPMCPYKPQPGVKGNEWRARVTK